MSRLLSLFLCFCLVVTPGCSLFRSSTQPITVSATDPMAELFADGQPIGVGTATVNLKRNESHVFTAKMADGRAGTAQVGRSLSDTAMLDIVGGILFLLPFVGLLAPGAWDLDLTTVVIAVPQS